MNKKPEIHFSQSLQLLLKIAVNCSLRKVDAEPHQHTYFYGNNLLYYLQ